jgi:hypothetical protein
MRADKRNLPCRQTAQPHGGTILAKPGWFTVTLVNKCGMYWKTKYRICNAIFFGGLINFAVFWCATVSLGGDAVSGTEEGGRYFLSSHGHLTEVSHGVFTYSLVHTYSIFFTHPLAILAGFIGQRIKKSHDSRIA